MAAKPRTTYNYSTDGPRHVFIARCGGYGTFKTVKGTDVVMQERQGGHDNVGSLQVAANSYDDFKLLFTAWWEDVAPWETVAYDIVIYDRLGRPLGAATEHQPKVARREMRRLLEESNGARGVILRRNKRTLEVKQVAGFKRRTRRTSAAVTP